MLPSVTVLADYLVELVEYRVQSEAVYEICYGDKDILYYEMRLDQDIVSNFSTIWKKCHNIPTVSWDNTWL